MTMIIKRIIDHWTVGRYEQIFPEYHYSIAFNTKNKKAYLITGKYKPEDNLNCADGKYAAHTGGLNTGSIGIGVCAMLGFVNKNNVGKYPITKEQCELLFKTNAERAKKYKLMITPDTLMTHYEVGLKHPESDSRGKIDIIYLPPFPDIKANEVGDFIRDKSLWYYAEL